MKREFRFGFTPEVRGEADSPKIVGYAAVFNQEADLGYFREVIKPGAFKRSINEGADVRALVEHDPAMIIGRSKAGSLTMAEDTKGLRVEITPPDTQIGRDVITNLRNGNLDKMSFGFYIHDGGQNVRKVDGQILREITDVDLFDVSVVAFPAYEGTTVQSRSLFPDGAPEYTETPEVQEVPSENRYKFNDKEFDLDRSDAKKFIEQANGLIEEIRAAVDAAVRTLTDTPALDERRKRYQGLFLKK